MNRSAQAVAVIVGWTIGLLGTILFAPFSQLALGVVLGAVLTAAALGAAVKLSVDGLFEQTASNIDAINEAVPDEQRAVAEDRERPDIETQTAFNGDFDE